MVKVSVVVPVYNAGAYIDRRAVSLLEQSMSADDYEVIYVNDGSTDDSARRIAELQQRYAHVRTVDQENSGWPGKPRNVGISMARGEYVQFVDQDDALGHEALARLYDRAVRDSADIVVGAMGGSMAKPNSAFRRNISGGMSEVPAMETLTGHKMFSRRFLLENEITFPEGYWRGEDLLFVTRCYARGPRVAIVADYTCYFWHKRDDNQNNSLARFRLAEHYDRLAVIIETLRDGMEPGDLRDHLMRRLYRVETMRRVREPFILDKRKNNRHEAFVRSRRVALSCFPPSVAAGLPATQRLRASLLESGTFEGLEELASRSHALRPRIERSRPRLGSDGTVRVQLRFTLVKPGGEPLCVVRRENEWLLDPEFVDGLPGIAEFPVRDPLTDCVANLQLEDRARQVWWYPEGDLEFRLEGMGNDRYAVVAAGDLTVRPQEAAGGGALEPGEYVIWFNGQLLGIGRRRRISAWALAPRLRGWTALPGARSEVRLGRTADHKLLLAIRDRAPRTASVGRFEFRTASRAEALARSMAKRFLTPKIAGRLHGLIRRVMR